MAEFAAACGQAFQKLSETEYVEYGTLAAVLVLFAGACIKTHIECLVR